MTSSAISTRLRKRPEERRDEILAAAATIAIEEGLERITLRAVAERLGVRPGLITHYFPAADDLVVRAFARAAEAERERFFPSIGGPVERLAHFLHHIETGASEPLARLWLNARHLSRFRPALNDELEEQDALDRARLVSLIRDGVASGDFAETDAEAAGIRILIAIDGSGSYVNSSGDYTRPVYRHFVADVAEWVLRITPGSLRTAIDARRASSGSS
ncbi:TetR/AcrR family transcriptional regulator [Microbacterium sp. HD4P20]|uniref:TetR/AcrR family transcriptional regulator n=1 Tax=Microbacterium sp. HD4P20 TaxID=2864874 RepID=UPI001C6422E6|nr:TetR/AcrR family transcriptional regulator [Microbacterium sp. HD4P20]MCP2636199.1 TetR/AcrR family transcriptional regulator [Microbacterium sp. HD4P20]